MHGSHPGFLLEFALCAHEWRFAGVELARRQFIHPAASGVTVLPEQADAVLVVDGDDRRAARVMRDFERRDRAVGERYLLDSEPDDPAPEYFADFMRHVCFPVCARLLQRSNLWPAVLTCVLRLDHCAARHVRCRAGARS